MDLPWDDLRVFLAAWESGSLTAAATQLGVGQATASRRIAALEEHIGQRLFDRTRGGLVATDAARALQPHAERMAEQARLGAAALAGLAAEPEGRVRVAVPPGIAVDVLPPLVPELRRRHPKVRLEILADNFMRDLARHEADIAMRSWRPQTGDLVFRRMPAVPIGVYASETYISSLPADPRPEHLAWLQWSADMEHIPLAQYVAAQLGGRAPVLTTNSFPTMRAAAVQGLGCMLLPGIQARMAGLTRVPVDLPALPPAPFFLIVPRALRSVPRVAAVVEFLVEVIERYDREHGWSAVSRPAP